MTFNGSKNKFKNDIPPIINKYIEKNDIKVFIDCTCGGANLTDKIVCKDIYGIDLSPSLIALHLQAQQDFSQIPTDGSREMWDKGYSAWKVMKQILDTKPFADFTIEDFDKISIPLYQIGCIEWYASFSNRGFPGGYAKNSTTRNYYQEAWRNHKKQSETDNYKKINFCCGDYQDLVSQILTKEENLNLNILLYIDPPYKDTKPYAISKDFNYERLYEWLNNISKICPIFVSEQYLPEEFNKYQVWEKKTKRTIGLDNNYSAKEKLWLIDKRNINKEN